MDEPLLELETRHRVYRMVLDQPGLHLSELARAVELQVHHARYHLDRLAAADLVASVPDEGFVRYYARTRTQGILHDALGHRDKEFMTVLRRARPAQIVLVLLVDGPSSLTQLAGRLGRAPSTLSFHLDRLVQRGVVCRLGELSTRRYTVQDPEGVMGFLLRHPPAPRLVGAFIGLWDGLALPAGKRPAAPESQAPPAQEHERPTALQSAAKGPLRLLAWVLAWRFPSQSRSWVSVSGGVFFPTDRPNHEFHELHEPERTFVKFVVRSSFGRD